MFPPLLRLKSPKSGTTGACWRAEFLPAVFNNKHPSALRADVERFPISECQRDGEVTDLSERFGKNAHAQVTGFDCFTLLCPIEYVRPCLDQSVIQSPRGEIARMKQERAIIQINASLSPSEHVDRFAGFFALSGRPGDRRGVRDHEPVADFRESLMVPFHGSSDIKFQLDNAAQVVGSL
jgi:hypothetical protein